MANPVPNNLALSVINTGDTAQSAPLRNNYAAIQTAVNELIACLSGGIAGQFLSAVDGTDTQWSIPSGAHLTSGIKTANVTTTGTTFAAGADILTSALSFTADGISSYVVRIIAPFWFNSGANEQSLHLNLSGADAGLIADTTFTAANAGQALSAAAVITPSAGAYTVNVRLVTVAGTATVSGGAGGVNTKLPILVTVEKL